MDSTDPFHERHLPFAIIGQDVSQPVHIPSVRPTPGPLETPIAYQPTVVSPSAAVGFGGQSGQMAAVVEIFPPSETELRHAPESTYPVIVPVLSAEVREDVEADPWEQAQAPDDGDTHWPDDDAFAALDLERELLGADEHITGKPIMREDAFAFHERSMDGWKRMRKTVAILVALALMLLVAVVGGVAVTSYARKATKQLNVAPSTPTVSSYSGGLVIQPGSEANAPTPEVPLYQIGAWMSSNSPSGGSVKVFVRITHDVAPVPHVPVSLAVQIPGGILKFGPTKTDAYGLATFTVQFGGLAGTPCFVTATATIEHQVYTADTVFVPL
ncbi:MAG TPA: hypothetical protein VFN11_00140 [Ktedonobacterales bacterium]|nr:hypothetical protein [Ktedonobacterales bacterium]